MSEKRWSSKKPSFASAYFPVFLFQFLAILLVFLYNIQHLNKASLFFGLGLLFISWFSSFLIGRIGRGDSYLLPIVNLIYSIGAIMIYRIKPELGSRHLLMYTAGMLVFFTAYLVFRASRQHWEGKTLLFFGLTAGLLLITLFFGQSKYGAKNWLKLGPVSIQPSELAKIPFVFMIASWFSRYEDYQKNWLSKFSLSLMTYALIGIFFLEHELGTAVVFFLVMIGCQLAFEKNKGVILTNLILSVLGLIAAYYLFSHVRVRFEIWKDPWKDFNNKGYQIIQGLFAISEGGFFGTGIGLGQPDRIPLGYMDFIYAAIIEEMGAFMGICLILLYIILTYRACKIAMKQEQDFYAALALAVSLSFAFQALIMFAGTLKVIPLTGITIPFLTYGGSSLLSSFILLAVLIVASEDAGGEEVVRG